MRFKPGQEVVCVNAGGWGINKVFIDLFGFRVVKRVPIVGPVKDEIVTVAGHNDSGYVYLNEYHPVVNGARGAYDEDGFEPVVPSEVIEELMEETKIEAI